MGEQETSDLVWVWQFLGYSLKLGTGLVVIEKTQYETTLRIR
jgi:hypothetical protein